MDNIYVDLTVVYATASDINFKKKKKKQTMEMAIQV